MVAKLTGFFYAYRYLIYVNYFMFYLKLYTFGVKLNDG